MCIQSERFGGRAALVTGLVEDSLYRTLPAIITWNIYKYSKCKEDVYERLENTFSW